MVASLLLAGGSAGAALHSSSPTSLLEASSSLTPPIADAALNVSSLSIDGGAGSESLLSLGNFVLSSTPAGEFEVRAPDGRTALSVDAAGAVSVHGQLHARGSLRVDGKLNYLGLSQWFLARAESFEASCSAWSNCTRTSCGAIRMLGGYGAFAGGEVPPSPAQFRRAGVARAIPPQSGAIFSRRHHHRSQVSKLFVRLDTPHTELRLKATFHYIDRWEGASAYARVDSQFVWAESYALPPAAEGVNLCGGDAPENRFAVAIDAVVPHNSTVANILFGATLDAPATHASWGVSDLQLFLR